MTQRTVVCFVWLLAVSAAFPSRVAGQFQVPVQPAIGETYHVELMGGFWNPTPELVISSSTLGIPGTDIDFVADLGMAKKRFPEFRVVLRPARKHKFRIQYVPIEYAAEATVAKDLVFNGARFEAKLPVESSLRWRAWRFGYEYDFISRSRGFVGLILEAKYTDVEALLENPIFTEFTRAKAPIPAIGGIGRAYVVPNVAVTFELTGFKIPEQIDEETRGRYLEYDIYGTANFTENVGIQIGYRSLDVSYIVETDAGDLALKGLYFAGVARF